MQFFKSTTLTVLSVATIAMLWSFDANPVVQEYYSDYSGASAVDEVPEKQTIVLKPKNAKVERKTAKKVKTIKLKSADSAESALDKTTDKALDIDMIDYEKDLQQASGPTALSQKDDYALFIEEDSAKKSNQKAYKHEQNSYQNLVAEIKALEKKEAANQKNDFAFDEKNKVEDAKAKLRNVRKYDSLKRGVKKAVLKDLKKDTFIVDKDYKFDYPNDIYDADDVGIYAETGEPLGYDGVR